MIYGPSLSGKTTILDVLTKNINLNNGEILVDNKRIDLIICGGLVKIQECTGHLQPLNHFFPMQMDEIIISDENVNKK